jgi:predicted dehydrogenase
MGSKSSLCRWGILGTAGIARTNWHAILNSGNSDLTCVASRSESRAQEFIDSCQCLVPFPTTPRAIGSYEGLLASDQVDAVYIPLPTGVRKEWVIRAAEAGKHVLVEKPCAVNAADLAEMLAACQKNGVQFMDGVMFMHSSRLPAMREVFRERRQLGEINRIMSQFSFLAPEGFLESNIRASSDLEPLGCLGDLGWYTVRFSTWAMDWQMPERVRGQLLQGHRRADCSQEVPIEFCGELYFAGGVTAEFYTSFRTQHQQWVSISGTRGHLRIDDFVLPYFGSELTFETTNAEYHFHGCSFDMEPHRQTHRVSEYSNNTPNAQESKMIRTFAQNVLSASIDPHWGRIALQTQRILDTLVRSAQQGGVSLAMDA